MIYVTQRKLNPDFIQCRYHHKLDADMSYEMAKILCMTIVCVEN